MSIELALDSDQTLFRETTARFLADTVPLTRVRELEGEAAGFESEWWRSAAELGWTSMLGPDELGGGSISGSGVRDLAIAAYERGRLVSPGPFAATNAVVDALASHSGRTADVDELLTRLMGGAAVAAPALDEPRADWGPDGIGARAEPDGDAWVVTGTKAPVESAAEAAAFLVAVRSDQGPMLVLVRADAQGVSVTPRGTVDLVRRFGTLHLDGVAVDEASVIAHGGAAVHRCADVANALLLSEIVGAIDRVFEFTLEWAFDRHTFGRPLASYQELKHRFADMKLWLESSKATVAAAVRAVSDRQPDSTELVSAAKSFVAEHAPELVQDCVQMHGGIGVTWDHDIHLYLRRVTLDCALHGTVRDHRQRLASLILAEG